MELFELRYEHVNCGGSVVRNFSRKNWAMYITATCPKCKKKETSLRLADTSYALLTY